MPKLLLDPFPLPTRIGNRLPKRKTSRTLPLLPYEMSQAFIAASLGLYSCVLLLRADPQEFFGGEFSLLVPCSQLRFSVVQLGNLLEGDRVIRKARARNKLQRPFCLNDGVLTLEDHVEFLEFGSLFRYSVHREPFKRTSFCSFLLFPVYFMGSV